MAADTIDALKAAVEALPPPLASDPHVKAAKVARYNALKAKESA